MQLTAKQAEGLKIAIKRYKDHEPYTCIAGYAGTGKTTLIRFIIDALEIPQNQVAYIAYTGKASLVMRNRGCPTSTTSHKFLYRAKKVASHSGFKYSFVPKKKLDDDYEIIVVDEVSMIPKQIWDQLLSHHIHVIAMGDPYQLPPVQGSDNGILAKPHIFLDEIMRQEENNEIIRLSMDIRNQKTINFGKFKDTHIMRAKEMTAGMFTWADQILCGKNKTRGYINEICRKMKFKNKEITAEPFIGDKIICVHNDWDTLSMSGEALMNGTIGIVQSTKKEPTKLYKAYMDYNYWVTIDADNDLFLECYTDYKYLTTGTQTITSQNFKAFPKGFTMDLFDYGYAITCWKAQGSEYDKILFYAENVGGLSRDMYSRYLYTGVTRCRRKLALVLPDNY